MRGTALAASLLAGIGATVLAACASSTAASAPPSDQTQRHDVTGSADPSYWSPARMRSAAPAPMPGDASPSGTDSPAHSPQPAADPSPTN